MVDFEHLDRMSIEELETLEDGIRQSIEGCRQRKQWALAWWWRIQQTHVIDAQYRAHLEKADPRFVRSQLQLPGMPNSQPPAGAA